MAIVVQGPVRSLLHPHIPVDTADTEPLPLYTPQVQESDTETASIISEAPTYRSDPTPPYIRTRLLPLISRSEEQAIGLPNRQFAPGFRPRGPVGDVSTHSCNVTGGSRTHSRQTTRQYENVARRRIQRDASGNEIRNAIAIVPAFVLDPIAPISPETVPGIVGEALTSTAFSGQVPTPSQYSPSEDPALVGEAAAASARSHRLYREQCLADPSEALGSESKSWDFMMAQVRDWDERRQNRNNLRNDMEHGKRDRLTKRIGLRRRH